MQEHDMLLATSIDGDSNRDTNVALDELVEVSQALKDPHKAFFNLFTYIPGWTFSDVCLEDLFPKNL
jgi:hypothetical protein